MDNRQFKDPMISKVALLATCAEPLRNGYWSQYKEADVLSIQSGIHLRASKVTEELRAGSRDFKGLIIHLYDDDRLEMNSALVQAIDWILDILDKIAPQYCASNAEQFPSTSFSPLEQQEDLVRMAELAKQKKMQELHNS